VHPRASRDSEYFPPDIEKATEHKFRSTPRIRVLVMKERKGLDL
jgi:hypothetical protein